MPGTGTLWTAAAVVGGVKECERSVNLWWVKYTVLWLTLVVTTQSPVAGSYQLAPPPRDKEAVPLHHPHGLPRGPQAGAPRQTDMPALLLPG